MFLICGENYTLADAPHAYIMSLPIIADYANGDATGVDYAGLRERWGNAPYDELVRKLRQYHSEPSDVAASEFTQILWCATEYFRTDDVELFKTQFNVFCISAKQREETANLDRFMAMAICAVNSQLMPAPLDVQYEKLLRYWEMRQLYAEFAKPKYAGITLSGCIAALWPDCTDPYEYVDSGAYKSAAVIERAIAYWPDLGHVEPIWECFAQRPYEPPSGIWRVAMCIMAQFKPPKFAHIDVSAFGIADEFIRNLLLEIDNPTNLLIGEIVAAAKKKV